MCILTVEQKAFEVYQESLTPMTSKFPCAEEDIMDQHEQGMKEAIEIFRKETLMDSDIENFGANLKEFTVLIYYHIINKYAVCAVLINHMLNNLIVHAKSSNICHNYVCHCMCTGPLRRRSISMY